ncbi:ankyrin repeat domain-containing protein 60 [Leptodactylus fuscus]|uniref:ankyrin repeat domain-containing protein 60 n=1 Tax=Leptodactylus fuscus TaxID=238119 RepID=UPI003F4EC97F
MASLGMVKSPRRGSAHPQDEPFTVNVRLRETGEKFLVPGCSRRMKVGELKEKLELLAGIPKNLQSLSFLDDGDMPDNSTLQFNGIHPRAKLFMHVWPYDSMTDLIKFAVAGDLEQLKSVGATPDSTFYTVNSLRLNTEQKKEWLADRTGIALFIAAHRGHLQVIRYLLQNGCNVLSKTCLGNTALHVAAAIGNIDSMDVLLANGAQPQDTNNKGQIALDLARLWGNKNTERSLYFFHWGERAANALPAKIHLEPWELFAHQKHDSKLKTWWSGSYARRYMANLVSFPDFHGSHISAPPKKNPDKKILKKTNS